MLFQNLYMYVEDEKQEPPKHTSEKLTGATSRQTDISRKRTDRSPPALFEEYAEGIYTYN